MIDKLRREFVWIEHDARHLLGRNLSEGNTLRQLIFLFSEHIFDFKTRLPFALVRRSFRAVKLIEKPTSGADLILSSPPYKLPKLGTEIVVPGVRADLSLHNHALTFFSVYKHVDDHFSISTFFFLNWKTKESRGIFSA